MRDITRKECDDLIGEVGFWCFMGGVSHPSGRAIVEAGDHLILLEAGEKIPEEMEKLMQLDAQQYVEMRGY